jgi:cell division protein FtsW (lipid II flippase)
VEPNRSLNPDASPAARPAWRYKTSNALFVVGSVMLAALWWNGSVTWLVIAVVVAVICFVASHLLYPWSERFPRSRSAPFADPAHTRSDSSYRESGDADGT